MNTSWQSLHFLPLLVQGSIADDKMGSSADGEDDGGSKPDSDKMEEGCGTSS